MAMSQIQTPATSFAADGKIEARPALLFLSTVVLLKLFLGSLPPNISCLGLFGRSPGQPIELTWPQISLGLLLVLATVHLGLKHLPGPSLWSTLFEGWPQGALRRLPWARCTSMVLIGLCLAKVDQLWLALAFLVLLWQFQRLSRAGVASFPYLQRLSPLLWDFRLCWLACAIARFPYQPTLSTTPLATASVLLMAIALLPQNQPRLSFAFCFLQSKPTHQVCLERSLWLARLERLLLMVLLFFYGLDVSFYSSLCLYSFTSILLNATLQSIYHSRAWAPILRSEPGPWRDVMERDLPDLYSLDQYRGPRLKGTKPVECYGDGPLELPLEPPIVKTQRRASLPVETLAALGLLLLLAVSASSPNILTDQEKQLLTYQTRCIEVNGQPLLFHSCSDPGAERLLDALPYIRVPVKVGPEATLLTFLLCLTLLLGFSFRWRKPLWSLWGEESPAEDSTLQHLCLTIAGSVTLACRLDWLWFPPELSAGVFLVLLAQNPLPSLNEWSRCRRDLSDDMRKLFEARPARDKIEPALPLPYWFVRTLTIKNLAANDIRLNRPETWLREIRRKASSNPSRISN